MTVKFYKVIESIFIVLYLGHTHLTYSSILCKTGSSRHLNRICGSKNESYSYKNSDGIGFQNVSEKRIFRIFARKKTDFGRMKRALTIIIAALAAVSVAGKEPVGSDISEKKDTSSLRKLINHLVEDEVSEQMANMPNVEVGKGISFSPKDNSFKTTLRFRMQNMAEIEFDKDFNTTETDGQVKRLRLRFDGFIFSPKFLYSIQLGFTGSDAKPTPNGKSNLILDAIAYYKPNASFNLGFGQAKVKANRAALNSSGALQFVDRSIVNSEFGGDRDFGFFGEYHYGGIDRFGLSALASVTMGEGRNWGASSSSGLAYTGRLELFPMGRFHAKGEYIEGDTQFEETPKLMLGGGCTFDHHAQLTRGMKGSMLPDGETRSICGYYADMIFKYRGFAVNADYMGRHASTPTFSDGTFIYNGSGVNVQASYLFNRKWEVAVRNSSMFPDSEIRALAGYKLWNQSTLGITRYIIGHSLKVQLDLSYNTRTEAVSPYDRLAVRFQLELGL